MSQDHKANEQRVIETGHSQEEEKTVPRDHNVNQSPREQSTRRKWLKWKKTDQHTHKQQVTIEMLEKAMKKEREVQCLLVFFSEYMKVKLFTLTNHNVHKTHSDILRVMSLPCFLVTSFTQINTLIHFVLLNLIWMKWYEITILQTSGKDLSARIYQYLMLMNTSKVLAW